MNNSKRQLLDFFSFWDALCLIEMYISFFFFSLFLLNETLPLCHLNTIQVLKGGAGVSVTLESLEKLLLCPWIFFKEKKSIWNMHSESNLWPTKK